MTQIPTNKLSEEEIAAALLSLGDDPTGDRIVQIRDVIDLDKLPAGNRETVVRDAIATVNRKLDAGLSAGADDATADGMASALRKVVIAARLVELDSNVQVCEGVSGRKGGKKGALGVGVIAANEAEAANLRTELVGILHQENPVQSRVARRRTSPGKREVAHADLTPEQTADLIFAESFGWEARKSETACAPALCKKIAPLLTKYNGPVGSDSLIVPLLKAWNAGFMTCHHDLTSGALEAAMRQERAKTAALERGASPGADDGPGM